LIIGPLVSLTKLPRMATGIPQMKWVRNYCYMLRASLMTYMAGTAFLGLAYWDILYHLIFISVLVKKFALEEYQIYKPRMKRAPAHGAQPATIKVARSDLPA